MMLIPSKSPLRTADDVEAIIEGLKDGTIDIIATDHAPHHGMKRKWNTAWLPAVFRALKRLFPCLYASG